MILTIAQRILVGILLAAIAAAIPWAAAVHIAADRHQCASVGYVQSLGVTWPTSCINPPDVGPKGPAAV